MSLQIDINCSADPNHNAFSTKKFKAIAPTASITFHSERAALRFQLPKDLQNIDSRMASELTDRTSVIVIEEARAA